MAHSTLDTRYLFVLFLFRYFFMLSLYSLPRDRYSPWRDLALAWWLGLGVACGLIVLSSPRSTTLNSPPHMSRTRTGLNWWYYYFRWVYSIRGLYSKHKNLPQIWREKEWQEGTQPPHGTEQRTINCKAQFFILSFLFRCFILSNDYNS